MYLPINIWYDIILLKPSIFFYMSYDSVTVTCNCDICNLVCDIFCYGIYNSCNSHM